MLLTIRTFFCISIFFLLINSNPIIAQNYSNGIGARIGHSQGLTFKHFISRQNAVEAMFHTKNSYQGGFITILYELHTGAFGIDHLYWYYGVGGHVGFFDKNAAIWGAKGDGILLNLGVDGILGIEYEIEDIPFTASVDVKPFFDLLNGRSDYVGGALSLRYIF